MSIQPQSKREIAIHTMDPGSSPPESHLQALLHALDRWPERKLGPGQLSVALLTADEISRIHAEFLNDPSETDVITFPGDEAPPTGEHGEPSGNGSPTDPDEGFAGEICISLDRAKEGPLPFHSELTLYLVHGWLHLTGLSDRSPDEARAMRMAETAAFEWLKTVLPPEFGDYLASPS